MTSVSANIIYKSWKFDSIDIIKDVVIHNNVTLCEYFVAIGIKGNWIKYSSVKGALEVLK